MENEDVKTGHWIDTGDYVTTAYGSIDIYKCSECGGDALIDYDFEVNYCPCCGIPME